MFSSILFIFCYAQTNAPKPYLPKHWKVVINFPILTNEHISLNHKVGLSKYKARIQEIRIPAGDDILNDIFTAFIGLDCNQGTY